MTLSMILRAGLLLILLGAAFIGFGRLHHFNTFERIQNEFNGTCAPVSGIAGPRDMQIDPSSGDVYVSSFADRRLLPSTQKRGAIHIVNLNDPLDPANWRDRTHGKPTLFQPEGLYFFDKNGDRLVFVVNKATNSIELFQKNDAGDLDHINTFSERRLTDPVDVVATSPTSFYVTDNELPQRQSFIGRLRFFTQYPSGKIYHFNGVSWRVAADGLRFANGVNASGSGNKIYAAETSGGAIQLFDRDPANGSLSLDRSIELKTSPETIDIDQNGALWVASMPQPFRYAGHFEDATKRVPSRVHQISFLSADEERVEQVFSDQGASISASATASKLGNKLVIGAMLENKYLLCTLGS